MNLIQSAYRVGLEVELLPAFDGHWQAAEYAAWKVQTGQAELFDALDDSGVLVGCCVIEFRHEAEILAAVGDSKQGALVGLLPEVERMAKLRGMVGVCVDTFRPGLLRKLQASGYRGIAVRMWKGIRDGVEQI